MSLHRGFYYDEEKSCFYPKKGGLSFEELYNLAKSSKNTTNSDDKIINYEYENSNYLMYNPHFIEFIFPKNENKKIFITNSNQIIHFLKKYKDYNKFFYKEDSKIPLKNIMPEIDIPYIKIEIKNKIPDGTQYKSANKIVNESNIYIQDLSLSYNEYFENCEYIDDKKPYLEYSTERKNFFALLDNGLKENNFIGICGPEGIGKTASILGYCKIKNFDYFYFNTKAIFKYLNNTTKLLEIITN